ncbi:MAG TPA: phosphotransferase, partial [Herpetosiphonaceae bacterium]
MEVVITMIGSHTTDGLRSDERHARGSAMPVFPASPAYYLPRPDRLYRQLIARRRSAALDRATIDTILAAYGWQSQDAAQAPAGAGRSDSVIVPTAGGTKMLKRYKATVDPAAIVHEHSILRHLARLDVPAPRVNVALNGATLIQQGAACYAVFDVLEGYFQYHQYCLLPAQKQRYITASGTALGTLHSTLKDFMPDGQHPHGFTSRSGERVREIGWFIETLDRCRREVPAAADADRLEQRLLSLDRQLSAAALPRLIIHGDYGPYNLFFKPNAPIVILDFELARLDWRLTDLATALPSFARSRLGFHVRHMRAFLDGYRTRCAIDHAELALLPLVWQFLTLRRVVVLWQRYGSTGAQTWFDQARRKENLARWIADHQTTLVRWL